MNIRTVSAVTFLLALTAGCATTAHEAQPGEIRAAEPIRDGVDSFLTLAMAGEYARIAELVVPGQAAGFNGRVFVEDRFRMPPARFEIIAWDRNLIRVVERSEQPGALSSVPVLIRELATNETRTVFLNLHWQRAGGRWRLEPYPRE